MAGYFHYRLTCTLLSNSFKSETCPAQSLRAQVIQNAYFEQPSVQNPQIYSLHFRRCWTSSNSYLIVRRCNLYISCWETGQSRIQRDSGCSFLQKVWLCTRLFSSANVFCLVLTESPLVLEVTYHVFSLRGGSNEAR